MVSGILRTWVECIPAAQGDCSAALRTQTDRDDAEHAGPTHRGLLAVVEEGQWSADDLDIWRAPAGCVVFRSVTDRGPGKVVFGRSDECSCLADIAGEGAASKKLPLE